MCELFAFNSDKKENITPYLIEFYSHSDVNPHGWGIADIHGPVGLETGLDKASDSRFLPHLIKELLPTDLLLAHIRLATVGEPCIANCHPFRRGDAGGTEWTFMHNGTIFQGEELGKYQSVQKGTTDSERVMHYLIDQQNSLHDGNPAEASYEEKYAVIEEVIRTLAPGNKLNLVFTDGRRLFIHTNMEGTLYSKTLPMKKGIMFATVPLDHEEWQPVEMRRLLVYEKGDQVYRGEPHNYTYVPASELELPWYEPGAEKAVMEPDPLRRAIYHKYILPTEREPQDFVGIELEYPIVNRSRGPVDFDVVHKLSAAFADRFGMDKRRYDDDGCLYSAYSSSNGDDLSFDCSYNTLELSFGRERNIHAVDQRFREYYTWIQEYLGRYNHTLTGMGINPARNVNVNEPVKSERYRMLLHYLSTCRSDDAKGLPMHNYSNFGLFACASQVQLDVGQDQTTDVLNIFNKLEPLKSVLFANSYMPEEDLLLSRDYLWQRSAHGINTHNTGMYDVEFRSEAELMNYIESMSIYSMERGGKYIHFDPIPLRDYFTKSYLTGEFYDNGRYQEIRFAPQMEDLQFVRTFKLDDLTFRGTVEFRSVCEQPVRDAMTTAAFHAGLIRRYRDLDELLDGADCLYGRGYSPEELRRSLNRCQWPTFLDRSEISGLLVQVLDLAKNGLQDRGYGEESFLEPLYDRARSLKSPAVYMKEQLEAGRSMDGMIDEFAAL